MNTAELQQLFPSLQILSSPEAKNTYGRDWTKFATPNPSAVAFPENTEQVQKIVQWARKHKVAIVPSGGRTGLSGGAVAANQELVISFDKMNQLTNFNPVDRTVDCGPGVITEALQNYIKDKGFYFPVDFAARGSSQIGGNISTNAGGVKVLRYGSMRDWIAGLEVVTGQGEILNLNNGLVKNATGYDLRHLIVGSEGTLALVTRATVKFTVQPKPTLVMIVGVTSLENVMQIFQSFRDNLPLLAFEFFSDIALKRVLEHTHLSDPLSGSYPLYVLTEIELTEPQVEDQVAAQFEALVEKGWIADGVLSQNETQARQFWRLREDISEATAPFTPYKNDISVTISKTPDFLVDVDQVLKKNYPDFEVVWFGHIGDGNMHINILKPANLSSAEFIKKCEGVSELLFTIVKKYSGSISAEHGVGLLKKPYLSYTRSAIEVDLMRAIKKTFDPDLILNPGKIFDK